MKLAVPILLLAFVAGPGMARQAGAPQAPAPQTPAGQVTPPQAPAASGGAPAASSSLTQPVPPSVVAARNVLQEITKGQFDAVEAQYDARMAAAQPAGHLAAAWAGVLEQMGSFDTVVGIRAGKVQMYDVVIMTCKFEKALIDAEIAFGPEGKIAGIHFMPHQVPLPPWNPPSYANPSTFTEQPLTLVNGKFELPGTLTMPKGAGPFPAVVLLQASGPHDEDETIGPNKPLKDVAWGLASRGIAVFRYEKRTQKYGAQSNEDPAKLTVDDETMSDARVAVSLLAKQASVDPKRVFLVGHSIGAYLAPRIAANDPEIAGIVMLAGNTQPLEKLLVEEVRYVITSGGTPTAPAVPSPQDQKRLEQVEDSAAKIESPDLKPGDTVQVLDGDMPASYWLDLRAYSPVNVAKALKIPVLILQGGRDFQVPPATNFAEWKTALAGKKNVTLKLYPDLNHLFMTGTGPSLPQEYSTPGHVAEQVVIDIASWISADGRPPHLDSGQSR